MISSRNVFLGLVLGVVCVTGCHAGPREAVRPEDEPARLEPLPATGGVRVVLSAQAAMRLGIQLGTVHQQPVPPRTAAPAPEGVSSANPNPATAQTTTRLVVPFSAILYQLSGEAYAYTSPSPLAFVRAPVTIDYVVGDVAVLSNGPSLGTQVVTVGASELRGIEVGVGE